MPRLMPPAGEVGEALERVIGSETFARSGRARDLLRYLVAREQAGEADALKGYSIALDVFHRDSGFDPATDAVVRVQARRLRDLLAQYYQTEGANDPLRISIPRGGYVPAYSAPSDDGASSDAAPAAVILEAANEDPVAPRVDANKTAVRPQHEAMPRRGLQQPTVLRHIHFFWVAMGAVILMLAFVAYQVGAHLPEIAGKAPQEGEVYTGSVSGYLPAVYVDAASEEGDVGRIAAILRGALAGFDTLDLIARPYQLPPNGDDKSTDFLFIVSPIAGKNDIRIELRHASTGRNLLTRDIAADGSEDAIADILTSAAPVSGAIYAYISNNRLETPLTNCLLQNDGFYREPSEDHFILAYDCMVALESGGLQSPLVYSELAGLKLRGITSHYDYAKDFTRDMAMSCARKAIQLGPTSPYAHRAYGYLLLRLGNEGEAIGWMQKAYELNPFDLSMAASYAYALVFSGAYEAGSPILERAVLASSSHPVWWDYALFLDQFMLGDMDKAANATLALVTTKRAHYLAARMIVAHMAGDVRKTDALRAEITEDYPVFAADPRAFFTSAKYPADMTDSLVEAIVAAGLVSGS